MVERSLPGVRSLAATHAAFPHRYPALFESVARHAALGRRSFLFAASGEPLVPRSDESIFTMVDRVASAAHGFGAVFFIGYEALRDIERVDVPDAPPWLPARGFVQPVACAAVVDHASEMLSFVGDETSVAQMRSDISHVGVDLDGRPMSVHALAIEEDPPQQYLRAVRRAKEYIDAGDVFQANLSREWRLRVDPVLDPTDLYTSLCAANPAPFAALMRFGDAAIVSSSPERLLRGATGVLESRPIAGTRPRLPADDTAMIRELRANEKEQAEHLMLVDLIRNDLGKVARPGTVVVDDFMSVESYAHVHHLVSNVRCEPCAGTGIGAALAALFPGGTITGCPKVRCMEIIAELEGVGRGAYTGCVGYVGRDGVFDTNILIRTMVWRRSEVRFRAGAGIVADSDPHFELAETRAKAEGMLRAFAR